MAKTNNLTDFLTDIADGIRAKKGTTGKINPQNFRSEIESIETGVDTSDATAVALDILSGKTAYVNGVKITGTIATYDGTVEALSGASTNAMPVRTVEPPIAVETATNSTNNTVIEITTADEMSALLTEKNVGKMYKYVGESNGTFENGEIYVVEA